MQAIEKKPFYEFEGEFRSLDQDDLMFDEDMGSLYSSSKLLKMIAVTKMPEIAFVENAPKEEIVERADHLLASFESVGIYSQVFKARAVGNYPFSRQHKFLEEVATLTFQNKSVVEICFPTVGYEVVSKKYVGTLGIYDPHYGVISCNKVSHVINGFAEHPGGEEFITFSLRTSSKTFNFLWDDKGISYLGEGEKIYGYYIRTMVQNVLMSGVSSSYVPSSDLQWYHFIRMSEDREYLVNIDGISMLLMGVKRMVKEMYLNQPPQYVLKKSEVYGYRRKEGTRYLVTVDNQEIFRRTDRPVETQHTALHLINDAITVGEFKVKVRMLDQKIVLEKKYRVLVIDPNADILSVPNALNDVPFFRRVRRGTSRNSYVQNAVMTNEIAFFDDVSVVGNRAIFIGNNRVYYQKRNNYLSGSEFDSSMYRKRVFFRVNNLGIDNSFECQLGRLVSFVIMDPKDVDVIYLRDINEVRQKIERMTPHTLQTHIVKTSSGMLDLLSVVGNISNNKIGCISERCGYDTAPMEQYHDDTLAVSSAQSVPIGVKKKYFPSTIDRFKNQYGDKGMNND